MSEEASDGSPPRPVGRRIRKVMVVSSTSESESEGSVITSGTRRKRLRVLSDDGSDSSGSAVVAPRRRTLRALRDSDADSEQSDTGSQQSSSGHPKPTTSTNNKTSGFSSDSSEGNSEKCAICLLRFKDQEVGIPETCEHIFCLDCITEWSKNVNTCPVDRMSFNSITVRTCAGGRVLRTEPVQSRPLFEVIVFDDAVHCQVCGNPDNEATMLLCDGCDQGFHMHCLNPPLRAIPLEEWLCPNCDALMDTITTSELHNVIDNIMDVAELDFDEEIPPFRSGFLSEHISLRRSNRDSANADEPSTSSGRGGPTEGAPSTSRGSRGPSTSQASRGPRPPRGPPTRRRTTAAHTRKRRKPRTVIIEYELQTNGKFPITKTVKRKVKKRKSRRKPRTAARRAHVRASVRARLATLQQDSRVDRSQVSTAPEGVSQLSASRRSAGIPALSLFGDNELEYFSEDEHDVSEGGTAAVAARPSAGIFSAYRQARRKMISIPSPPHTSSAPDLVSSIMESQNLLHNKRSVVTISVDGKVDIKLESRNKREEKQPEKESRDNTRGDPSKDLAGSGRVDLSKSEGVTRKAPSYPGQGRSGGWGGGYRGNYHRDNPTGNFSRAYEYGAPGPRAPAPAAPYQHQDEDGQYNRRGSHYADDHYERPRRQERSQPHQAHQGRYSGGPGRPWQANQSNQSNQSSQYFGSHSGRHSFGGFDNPLDMRMPAGAFPRTQEEPASFQPLPEPPTFNFDKPDDKEDDRSDPELIIDTEKYDPTEPTNDDESGDDEGQEESPEALEAPPVLPAPALASPAPPVLPRAPTPPAVAAVAALSAPPLVQNILANFDTGSINVPANVLDDAVRQVLQEHRDLMMPRTSDRSDDDSDGDCPNFSIYSATSVHIAELPREPLPQRPVEVMPDDYPPPPDFSPGESANSTEDADVVEPLETPIVPEVKDRNQELKEKISKRCPITVSPRNPIKIKLNTPTLIRRHVSLYDEEDIAEEEPEPEPEVEKKSLDGSPEKRKESPVKETAPVEEKEPVAEEPETEDAGASPPKTPDEELEQNDDTPGTPTRDEANYSEVNGDVNDGRDDKDDEDDADKVAADEKYEDATEDENDVSDSELMPESAENGTDRVDEVVEKMTESISETEDERSYTPCLDENKSKDTSLETEKEKVLEGLDTEMISEEEADIFSDEGEEIKRESDGDDPKKKKKKESKKEKSKGKSKKSEVTFKKISKSGKERNYRERDKDDKKKKDRRESGSAERRQRRRERRKDLERYDVRSVVGDKRRAVKDAFGRDVSPHRSPSAPRPADRRSGTPRLRRSQTPRRKSISPRRKSISPRRRSISPRRRSISPRRRSLTPRRRSATPRRKSITPRRKSITPRRKSISPRRKSLTPRRKSLTPRRKSLTPRRKSISPRRKSSPRRRRSGSRASRPRKRARRSPSPKPKAKKKKRARSEAREGREPRKAGKRKRAKRASPSPVVAPPAGGEWSGASVDSRLLSPCTPPPRHRRSLGHPRHKRTKDLAGPSKEVFTSGDNILVSVSFKDQDRQPSKRKRKGLKRAKRLRRRAPSAQAVASKPVAIIDLERSPFREITPSPKNVIVLSDSDRGAEEGSPTAARGAAAAPGAPEPAPHAPHVPHVPHAPHPAHPAHAPHAPHAAHAASSVGPKTPPEPQQPVKFALVSKPTPTRPNPLRSPQSAAAADVYDPFQPTRSASASPASRASPASPAAEAPLGPPGPPAEAPGPRAITLETAQKTNMSADDVIDRRPLSPIEKVMALLQSTRDVSPEPPPNSGAAGADAPPPRIVLPSPTRPTAPPPKLFLAKPSPIKSNPVKPMQATKISRLPLPTARQASPYGDSPYSPGSSDFGDLFSPPGLPAAPPGPRGKRDGFDALFDKPFKKKKGAAAKVPVKLSRKKGKMQVGVKIDEDNLKILDDLPSSAVEMQVKSKFLKKLNRQERVVEEVKLVLKPHYNKKHVTKDEYKDVLRRCVPKICHNKSGEINPAKIQALVEAYVKKIRKKHKLGLA